MRCPYCGGHAILSDSSVIYGKSYGMVYICQHYPKCDSYVGVHKGTTIPLGRMANKELREWKKKAHACFDPMWKMHGLQRKRAYAIMRDLMEMTADQAHIAKFDVAECKRLILLISYFTTQVLDSGMSLETITMQGAMSIAEKVREAHGKFH